MVWPELLLAFVVGACVGSFLNVCITRWPHDLSVFTAVAVPALRAADYGARQHPDRELAAASRKVPRLWPPHLAALSRHRARDGGRVALAGLTFGPTFTAVRIAIFGTILLGIAVTDARHYLIPDGFTVFGLVWVFVTALVGTMLNQALPFADAVRLRWSGRAPGPVRSRSPAGSARSRLKREAMGFGDVTLMAVVGAAWVPARARRCSSAPLGVVAFLGVVHSARRFRRGHARSRSSSRSATRPPKLRMCHSAFSLRPPRCHIALGRRPAAWLTRA